MTLSVVDVARDLIFEHARRLHESEPVTPSSLLVAVGRCPICAGPLLAGDSSARCSSCGEKVETSC